VAAVAQYVNTFSTEFSHVNLCGVGCPDLGVILTMPTTGKLNTNYSEYGSPYKNELAKPGFNSSGLAIHAFNSQRGQT
tara:strand:- start:316 stop:549 length:234 start_codon:yes stop_codon:yes gene_type:complete